jgi:hypothetical protein
VKRENLFVQQYGFGSSNVNVSHRILAATIDLGDYVDAAPSYAGSVLGGVFCFAAGKP